MEAALATQNDWTDMKVQIARLDSSVNSVVDRIERIEDNMVRLTESVATLAATASVIAKLAKPVMIVACVLIAAIAGRDLPLDKLVALFQ